MSAKKFHPGRIASELNTILESSNKFGINRSFVNKVVFGQVSVNATLYYKDGITVEFNGVFNSESPNKTVESLKDAGSLAFYQLLTYWIGRLMNGRQVLSYTSLILAILIQTLLDNGLKNPESLTLAIGEERTSFSWEEVKARIAYMVEIAPIVEKHESINAPKISRTPKPAPILSSDNIEL